MALLPCRVERYLAGALLSRRTEGWVGARLLKL